VWDSVLYEYTGRQKLPFNESEWIKIGMHAQRTNSLFDIGEHESSDLNPHYWVDEAN